jgi:N-glycosidase YbiA
MISLELLQNAVKKIEMDGPEGFHAAAKLVGWEMATAIHVSRLRVLFSFADFGPAPDWRDDQVLAELRREDIFPPEYMRVLVEGGELFYMSRAYALDNFSAFTVEHRGSVWPTLEHAWQADKFFESSDPDKEEVLEMRDDIIVRILEARSAHEAKKIAHEPLVRMRMRERSDEEKKKVMRNLINLKFDQHEYVRKTLERTKGLIIVEDSDQDFFWGRGADWTGRDFLGKLWTELRIEKFGA